MAKSNQKSNFSIKRVALGVTGVVAVMLVLGLARSYQTIKSTQSVSVGRYVNSSADQAKRSFGAPAMAPTTSEMMAEPMIEPDFARDGVAANQPDRAIVRTGQMSILVENTQEAVQSISDLTQSVQGFVSNTRLDDSNPETGAVFASMTIRVPSEQLDEVVSQIRNLATKVELEQLSAVDKTEQKVDLEAQIRNLETTEAQLASIMSQAKTVEETLKVQKELTSVRDRIERLQASLENLDDAANYATLQVSISTEAADLPVVAGSQRSFMDEIKLTVKETIRVYRGLAISAVKLVIFTSPAIVVLGIGLVVFRLRKRS